LFSLIFTSLPTAAFQCYHLLPPRCKQHIIVPSLNIVSDC
jgi:hypothetical protein